MARLFEVKQKKDYSRTWYNSHGLHGGQYGKRKQSQCSIKSIQHSEGDDELLEFIYSTLKSFEDYYATVMEDQLLPLVYSGEGIDGEQYRTQRASFEKQRTVAHNALIANENLLNRMAGVAGIEPVYEGVVSENRPYRRIVANAVFDYISYIIDQRSLSKTLLYNWR